MLASFDKTWGTGITLQDSNALDTDKWVSRDWLSNMLLTIREEAKQAENGTSPNVKSTSRHIKQYEENIHYWHFISLKGMSLGIVILKLFIIAVIMTTISCITL